MVNILISLALLIVAVLFQIKFFNQTQSIREKFREIFPARINNVLSAYKDDESNTVQMRIDPDYKASSVFTDIVDSINHYLRRNKGAAEYAILKDITDRNCDAVEEQIEATSPFPIYVGLCGTLIGIVFGVAVLGYGGGIDSLLSSSSTYSTELPKTTQENMTETEGSHEQIAEDAGAMGIKDLLRGVAVAMLTTFIGVILTILGSTSSKNAARDNEYRKNQFLSWMQGELLPQMNDNMVKTLDILQRNLSRFNEGFAENSQNLNDVFSRINTTYEGQAEILRMVQELRVDDIATANIKVLKELQKCTDKINLLQEFLNQSNQYLSSVESMNGHLANHYDRTLLIENMGRFFMDEVQQIEQRKSAISQSVAQIDLAMQRALEELQSHTKDQYVALTSATAREHAEFLRAVEEQQQVLSTKLTETSQVLEELKNLVAVKDSIAQLAQQGQEQQIAQIAELQAIKSALSGLTSSSSQQNEIMKRLASAIEGMELPGLDLDGTQSKNNKRISGWTIALMVIGVMTCITIMGSCGFYIYKMLF